MSVDQKLVLAASVYILLYKLQLSSNFKEIGRATIFKFKIPNMVTNRIILVMLLFFNINLADSQELVSIPNMPISLSSEFPNEIIERYNKVKDYNYKTLDEASKDIYDFVNTVYHLYIVKDSANYYFDRMIQRSPRRVCRILISANTNHKRRIDEGYITLETNWFLEDLPNKDPQEILHFCQAYMVGKRGDLKPSKRMKISDVIKRIDSLDSKYRIHKEVDWDMQDRADSINRITVDSLYRTKGSLKDFSNDEIFVFSIVLHHSKDCEWNIKWTEIFFKEIANRNTQGAPVLQEAVKR